MSARLAASLVVCCLAAAAGCRKPRAEAPKPASPKQVDCLRLERFEAPQKIKINSEIWVQMWVANRGERPVLVERIETKVEHKEQFLRVINMGGGQIAGSSGGGGRTWKVKNYEPRRFVLLEPAETGEAASGRSLECFARRVGSREEPGAVKYTVTLTLGYYFFGEAKRHVKQIKKAFIVKVEK